jgi:predicted short-subunit dehydrogenase-like oxidoreductase (DUF2520 family)
MKIGSCHPLQTFESPKRALKKVGSSYFCIEGESAAVRAATRLVRTIGGSPFTIRSQKKALYHAAAVLGSAGVVSLLSISIEALIECKLTEHQARRVLLPLVEGTVANVRGLGPSKALTGPVRRGDSGTIRRNIDALRKTNTTAAVVYALLAERAVGLAIEAGVDPKDIASVRDALK